MFSRASLSRRLLCSHKLLLAVAIALVELLWAGPATAATVVNGGFETGTFNGWTVLNQANGSGNWFVYSGTTSPLSASTLPSPPQGTYAATSDQTGPGSHVLYQDVALEPGAAHVLSFILYYNNQNGAFFTPATLDYTVNPNQQYRVDIMRPAASPFSVAPADVLLPVFRTNVGAPASLAPTTLTADLSAFAGMTVRIRFAEVDNQFYFQAGVDAVSIQTTDIECPTGVVPTIVGTAGPDAISGTPGNDIIFGLGGDDRIAGNGGDDIICGGDGNDQIAGGDGNDRLFGGNGADSLSGDTGADTIYGNAGNDRISGGPGADKLFGADGDDQLSDVDGASVDVLAGGAHVNGDSCAADVGDTVLTCNP